MHKKAWKISENPETEERTKVQALSLAKECVINKLELLTNATVVDDAIRFASEKSKENLKPSCNGNEDDKESKEPDYDEDQLEEKQEEQPGEIASTTNQIF